MATPRPLAFSVQLSATRRGARLGWLLAAEQLRSWGLPFAGPALVVGELTANAVLHGRVPGRDFRLALTVSGGGGGLVRVAVTDARGDSLPGRRGYGLALVDALAERWGVEPGPFPCKTVWAEVACTGSRWTATR
ncbi:ATP-binding protein [Streptomyces coeruleoprunus]|uniref:ATP-binding protein n=1 Tax=Streptomyces coeruleoprunus TaxID=285563 RepID=UPI0031E8CF84